MMNLKYQMIIQWSEEDNCFLVGCPDFPGQTWRTHGDSYQEAVNNGIEALESLVIAYQTTGENLPQPTFNQAA
ncbi:type II toxin-antitoxin system HicB family antitoxin [Okeanomitos corallinicola TIOX110]|uniref:Type II toxin-antitoxin system HicB family antitoxin n=1 Tax=Okeanomitos corallinicola TIOX110 TaxID=3133117 RepID=A0ABZ2UQG3_9CYAN